MTVFFAFQQEKTPVLNAVLQILNAHLDALTVALDIVAVVVGPGGLDAKQLQLLAQGLARRVDVPVRFPDAAGLAAPRGELPGKLPGLYTHGLVAAVVV